MGYGLWVMGNGQWAMARIDGGQGGQHNTVRADGRQRRLQRMANEEGRRLVGGVAGWSQSTSVECRGQGSE